MSKACSRKAYSEPARGEVGPGREGGPARGRTLDVDLDDVDVVVAELAHNVREGPDFQPEGLLRGLRVDELALVLLGVAGAGGGVDVDRVLHDGDLSPVVGVELGLACGGASARARRFGPRAAVRTVPPAGAVVVELVVDEPVQAFALLVEALGDGGRVERVHLAPCCGVSPSRASRGGGPYRFASITPNSGCSRMPKSYTRHGLPGRSRSRQMVWSYSPAHRSSGVRSPVASQSGSNSSSRDLRRHTAGSYIDSRS